MSKCVYRNDRKNINSEDVEHLYGQLLCIKKLLRYLPENLLEYLPNPTKYIEGLEEQFEEFQFHSVIRPLSIYEEIKFKLETIMLWERSQLQCKDIILYIDENVRMINALGDLCGELRMACDSCGNMRELLIKPFDNNFFYNNNEKINSNIYMLIEECEHWFDSIENVTEQLTNIRKSIQ